MGPTKEHSTVSTVQGQVNLMTDYGELKEQLKQMWSREFEDAWCDRSDMSFEDKRAVEILESAITKVDGDYQVPLPRRQKENLLPNNKPFAVARLKGLKFRLAKNSILLDKYNQTISAYLENRYAEKIPESQLKADHPV